MNQPVKRADILWEKAKNAVKTQKNEKVNKLITESPAWLKVAHWLFPKWVENGWLRSKTFDEKIKRLIKSEGINRIIELGAGLSDRGMRFAAEYPQVLYVDTDLACVIEEKQKMLEKTAENHVLMPFDIISDNLEVFKKYIEKGRALFVFEGVALYLGQEGLMSFLNKLKEVLSYSDNGYVVFEAIHQEDEKTFFIMALKPFLRWFFQENISPNFKDRDEGEQLLNDIGFTVIDYEKKRTINFYTIVLK